MKRTFQKNNVTFFQYWPKIISNYWLVFLNHDDALGWKGRKKKRKVPDLLTRQGFYGLYNCSCFFTFLFYCEQLHLNLFTHQEIFVTWPDNPPTFCQLSLVRKMLSSWVTLSLSGKQNKRQTHSEQNGRVPNSLLVFLHESLCSFSTVEQVPAGGRALVNEQLLHVDLHTDLRWNGSISLSAPYSKTRHSLSGSLFFAPFLVTQVERIRTCLRHLVGTRGIAGEINSLSFG